MHSERLYVAQMCGTILLKSFPTFWINFIPYWPRIIKAYVYCTLQHCFHFSTTPQHAIPWQTYNTGNQYSNSNIKHNSVYKAPHTCSLKALILTTGSQQDIEQMSFQVSLMYKSSVGWELGWYKYNAQFCPETCILIFSSSSIICSKHNVLFL